MLTRVDVEDSPLEWGFLVLLGGGKVPRKLTTEEFIEKAREVHGDRYGYEKVVYEGATGIIEIECKQHGYFWQQANHHKSGSGCPECFYNKSRESQRKSNEWFIVRAKEVHGDRYNYTNTLYKNAKTKIVITCKLHGDFTQTPNQHLNGHGCRKCGYESSTLTKAKDLAWFIENAKKVHGDVYDYSQTNYTRSGEKVVIVCKEHGSFTQQANSHLRGCGCPLCGGTLKGTTKSFIESARKIHKDKFDYSKVCYIDCYKKVDIVCNKHGLFKQAPFKHLLGQKCPECAKEENGWDLKGYYGTLQPSNLYVLKIDDSFIKIGLATEIHRRTTVINKESGYSVEKLYSVSGAAYKLWLLEQTILRLSDIEQHTPKVSFAGQSECVELEELDKVMGIVKEWEKFNKED